MTRVTRIARVVAMLTTMWLVAGAQWPMDFVMDILGGMPCC